ncbi:MAG: anti-sigma factor [Chloroflexota bacterium]|nr:anti-sigma factor [Chloroflexota bacterium]
MRCEEVQENIPALVLGALDEPDAEAVRQHVSRCAACSSEAGAYSRTTDALNLAVEPVELPQGFHSRLLARATAPDDVITFPTAPKRRPARLPWALAAACLLLALGLGAWSWRLNTQVRAERAYIAYMAQFIARPDVSATRMTASSATTQGRLYATAKGDRAMLVLADLPALPRGKVYQIWLNAPGVKDTAGTFEPLADGDACVYVHPRTSLSRYKSIGITIEPKGGSPGPTSPRIIGAEL